MTEARGSPAESAGSQGELRAGGTDVEARRRRGLVPDRTIDLRDMLAPAEVERRPDGSLRIAAMTPLASLFEVRDTHPGLTATACSLANPHIRAVATLGGAIMQRSRCPYFRTRGIDCHKTGVPVCPARRGDGRFGVIFDTSRCIAPHPSSMAMALLGYDASVLVADGQEIGIDGLLGDGSDPAVEHTLGPAAMLTHVTVPPGFEAEKASYRRITGRALAEWPMVEAMARLEFGDGVVRNARVVVGAVAPVPMRLLQLEDRILGLGVDLAGLDRVMASLGRDASPSPHTEYKVALLRSVVGDVLRDAATDSDNSERAVHE